MRRRGEERGDEEEGGKEGRRLRERREKRKTGKEGRKTEEGVK